MDDLAHLASKIWQWIEANEKPLNVVVPLIIAIGSGIIVGLLKLLKWRNDRKKEKWVTEKNKSTINITYNVTILIQEPEKVSLGDIDSTLKDVETHNNEDHYN